MDKTNKPSTVENSLKPTDNGFDDAAGRDTRRGRPASSEQRRVFDNILESTITCLETQGPHEISLKKIAELADTTPSMINYYFGSKDGLLIEIVNEQISGLAAGINNIRKDFTAGKLESPMRDLISFLVHAYSKRPELRRILSHELFRQDSKVRDFYLTHWPHSTRTLVEKFVTELSASGYYRSDLNLDAMIEMIRSVVFWPLIVQPVMPQIGGSAENFADESWVELVSDVLESYFRAP